MEFGVGSFAFAFRNRTEDPVVLTSEQYFAAVRNALNALPNISEVAISTRPESWAALVAPGEQPRMIDGDWPVPDLDQTDTAIQFRIRIPQRVQESVSPFGEYVGAEDFWVVVRWEFRGPVAFVVTGDPSADAPRAVALVREFLKAELPTRQASIELDFVGPSPLHVSCAFLPGTSGQSRPFESVFSRRDGFDRYEFSFDPDLFRSEEEAFWRFIRYATDDLAPIYVAEIESWRERREWEAIEEGVSELLALYRRPGWKARLSRIRSMGREASELSIQLAEFEIEQARRADHIRTLRSHAWSGSGPPFFEEVLEEHLVSSLDVPTAQATRIISIVESQRASQVNLVALGASSVVGGAVGSLLTILAG